jgi:ribonuclease P protein component
MESLKRRAAFKAVAGARRVTRPGFVLQALKAGSDGKMATRPPRFGFTVTKKIGNAVVRNRIRRRLREVVRRAQLRADAATDYVLVARRAALTLQFERLVTDLTSGFEVLSRQSDRPRAVAAGSIDAR